MEVPFKMSAASQIFSNSTTGTSGNDTLIYIQSSVLYFAL